MIEDLTKYELQCLVDNFDRHSLEELTEFFAGGGFTTWTDTDLSKKMNLIYQEENGNA